MLLILLRSPIVSISSLVESLSWRASCSVLSPEWPRSGQALPRYYRIYGRRRCFRAVDFMLDESPKLIAIDEKTDHHVVHMLCLGKADCPAYQPLDPRAPVN